MFGKEDPIIFKLAFQKTWGELFVAREVVVLVQLVIPVSLTGWQRIIRVGSY